ncbi:hypothetical protein GpartN1_g2676.t1 [Galdieria partita]|uniref:BHLH domain-containing protein n=1 Tax=Galdieria partita TaxID=83374 RepID=A0A9C7UPU6_9RHOD|nr:hypothetical protein GpartN1_g2676.t1 [Galdieria partita]
MDHTSLVVREALKSAHLRKRKAVDERSLKTPHNEFSVPVDGEFPWLTGSSQDARNSFGPCDTSSSKLCNSKQNTLQSGSSSLHSAFSLETKSNSFSSSSEGTGDHSKLRKKREREKKRRMSMNKLFERLMTVVSADRFVKKDKESVITQTIEYVQWEQQHIAQLESENRFLREQVDELRAEKNELRSDKIYLKNELHSLKDEVEKLRNDNVILWQSCRKGDAVVSDSALDAALRGNLLQDYFDNNDFNQFLGSSVFEQDVGECSIPYEKSAESSSSRNRNGLDSERGKRDNNPFPTHSPCA